MDAQMLFLGRLMDRCKKNFLQQSTSVVVRHSTNEFFITPSKSMFKIFLGTHLREQLFKMSAVKSAPEGLKVVECEHGVGGKNAPICYITEQDPVHEALKKPRRPRTSS